jgi:hypothetical protein
VMEALSIHSQREGRPVFDESASQGKHLATPDLRIWTESKPGAERRRSGESERSGPISVTSIWAASMLMPALGCLGKALSNAVRTVRSDLRKRA